jgi:hypothetical protein
LVEGAGGTVPCDGQKLDEPELVGGERFVYQRLEQTYIRGKSKKIGIVKIVERFGSEGIRGTFELCGFRVPPREDQFSHEVAVEGIGRSPSRRRQER